MSDEQLIGQLQFSAAMIMSDVYCMELNLQVMMDLVMSLDGRIGGPQRTKDDP